MSRRCVLGRVNRGNRLRRVPAPAFGGEAPRPHGRGGRPPPLRKPRSPDPPGRHLARRGEQHPVPRCFRTGAVPTVCDAVHPGADPRNPCRAVLTVLGRPAFHPRQPSGCGPRPTTTPFSLGMPNLIRLGCGGQGDVHHITISDASHSATGTARDATASGDHATVGPAPAPAPFPARALRCSAWERSVHATRSAGRI